MPSQKRTLAVAEASSTPTEVGYANEQPIRPTKMVKLNPDGDLRLNMAPHDNEPYAFRVCSAMLRRHSPVWKAMLFGPGWIKSKPSAAGKDWVVNLLEDPASPIEIILDIIHGRFERVPQTLRLEDLYNLLVFTNKYDMSGILRPWCSQWIKVARRFCLDTNGIRRWLFVAWELGDEILFALRLGEIALRARVDEEGRLTYKAHLPARKKTEDILSDEEDENCTTTPILNQVKRRPS